VSLILVQYRTDNVLRFYSPWNPHIRENGHQLFRMLWALGEEVIRISMSTATYGQPISLNLDISSPATLTCGETRVGFCFYSMDQVWEESTIVDEETRYMVSDEIMVSALTVDLRSESMCIASRVCSTNSSHNDRETSKNVTGGVSLQPACRCEVAPISSGGEGAC
jgi:hypothetical protein